MPLTISSQSSTIQVTVHAVLHLSPPRQPSRALGDGRPNPFNHSLPAFDGSVSEPFAGGWIVRSRWLRPIPASAAQSLLHILELWLVPPPHMVPLMARVSARLTLDCDNGPTIASMFTPDITKLDRVNGFGAARFATWTALQYGQDTVLRVHVDVLPADNVSQVVQSVGAPSTANVPSKIFSQILRGEDLADTKFWVFSRRLYDEDDEVIGVQAPRPIYANSAILSEGSEYFRSLLIGETFSESSRTSFSDEPSELAMEEYDYLSDSDLCSDQGDEPELVDQRESRTETVNVNLSRSGRVVTIKGGAYVTWKALIYYLCTKTITFAPLSSGGKSKQLSEVEKVQGFVAKPSAKSIYLQADQLGLDELRDLALQHIRSELTPKNILEELFSSFTAKYPAIQDMELEFASTYWDAMKRSPGLQAKLQEIAEGQVPHAKEMLVRLISL